MLYDNAQLARVFLHAWQVTGEPFFRTITEETLDYVIPEMTDPSGGFYSTQDADSEGEEGKFFVWTTGEIQEVLGDEADAFTAAYGVTRHGNFEGKNILEFAGDINQRPTLAKARRKLFEAREKRVRPGRDEKVLTSWNGLMLAAFAEAARILDRDDYRMIAERNAAFLWFLSLFQGSYLRPSWACSVALSSGARPNCLSRRSGSPGACSQPIRASRLPHREGDPTTIRKVRIHDAAMGRPRAGGAHCRHDWPRARGRAETQLSVRLQAGALGIVGMTTLWDAVEFIRQEEHIRRGHALANPDRPVESRRR
jgi:hypothetical protein